MFWERLAISPMRKRSKAASIEASGASAASTCWFSTPASFPRRSRSRRSRPRPERHHGGQRRGEPDADAEVPPAAQARAARRAHRGDRLEERAGARSGRRRLFGLEGGAEPAGARRGPGMGKRRDSHQFAASQRGLRYCVVDRRGSGLARQGVQPHGRAIQEEQPVEAGSLLARCGRAGRGNVRPAFRQDHGGAGAGRRRQRARRLMAVEPLRWRGDRLELLDQRFLPDKTLYVTCRSAADVATAIRDMVVRGAPAIGCAAAFGVVLSSGSSEGYAALAKSRPTAVNLFWALERMKRAEDLEAEANAIFDEDLAANRSMGKLGAELIPDRARVMTHCNTGALATAGHGTALGVIRSAKSKSISVIACETRPYLQGARLTAWECVQEGIPCTLITDSMAGHLMSRGEVDVVIVGADRIAANGDVANKIGTYSLAVLARRHGIPFYVAAPLSTFDAATADGSQIAIEERPADEVTGYRGTRWAPQGVSVRNPAFDVTPAELVTALICEKGVLLQPSREGIASLLKGTPAADAAARRDLQ